MPTVTTKNRLGPSFCWMVHDYESYPVPDWEDSVAESQFIGDGPLDLEHAHAHAVSRLMRMAI